MKETWQPSTHSDPFAALDAADLDAAARESGVCCDEEEIKLDGNTIRSSSAAASSFRSAGDSSPYPAAENERAPEPPNTRGTDTCAFTCDQVTRAGDKRVEASAASGAATARRKKVDLCEAESTESNRPCTCREGSELLPQFHLRISDGKYINSIFRVPSLRERPGVGRSRHNAICLLADDQVSRFHAYIEMSPDGFVVLKDGKKDSRQTSSNGTFVNSNCTRIGAQGYRLHLGDVVAVGATEMVVEAGDVPETVCTSPPLQVLAPGIWLRPDNENPWKKQMEKGVSSSEVRAEVSRARQLALLMGAHPRLGSASPLAAVPDDDLIRLILHHSRFTIHRAAPPPLPSREKGGHQEVVVEPSTRCFPGGKTAEEFMNASSEPFAGRCGGVGARPCVGFAVTKVVRVLNSSLWRPYHWRKQCIAEGLPEMTELDSSKHLAAHAMGTGPPLDPAANEYLAFHGQSSFAIYSMKDAGICQEIGDPANMFGGGVYLSCSAFRANMSIPCSACGGGFLGGRSLCTCAYDAGLEHVMLVARVTLGDAHICTEYDAEAYRGPPGRPRRRPPVNSTTGFVHNSIIGESREHGGSHQKFRELVVYDRFQCYPEYIIHFKRVPGPPVSEGGWRGRRGGQCHLPW